MRGWEIVKRALLPQPGGFEGLIAGLEAEAAGRTHPLKGPDVSDLAFHLGSALSSSTPCRAHGDELGTGLDELDGLEPEPLPGLEISLDEGSHPFMAVEFPLAVEARA